MSLKLLEQVLNFSSQAKEQMKGNSSVIYIVLFVLWKWESNGSINTIYFPLHSRCLALPWTGSMPGMLLFKLQHHYGALAAKLSDINKSLWWHEL